MPLCLGYPPSPPHFHSGPKLWLKDLSFVTTRYGVPRRASCPLLLASLAALHSHFCSVEGVLPGDCLHIPVPHRRMDAGFTHGSHPGFSPYASSSLHTNWVCFLCSAKSPHPGVLFSRLLVNPLRSRGSFGVKGRRHINENADTTLRTVARYRALL